MKLQPTVYLMFFILFIVVSKNNKENEHLIDIFTSEDLSYGKYLTVYFLVSHCLLYNKLGYECFCFELRIQTMKYMI
jgi:hypothetical protein